MELVVALSLFTIVASAIGVLAGSQIQMNVRNKHAADAAFLAQQKLETLRAVDYASISGGTTNTSLHGQAYTVATIISANNPAANMSTITVTITWTAPEGARSYAVQTILTDITA